MTDPQDPGQQPDSTPPEWATTEFPAVPRYPAYSEDPSAPQGPYPQGPYPQGPYPQGEYPQVQYPQQNPYPQSGQQYGVPPDGYVPPGEYEAPPTYGGYPPPQGPQGPYPPTPTPSHGRRTALIAAVAVLVAAGAGVGIYFAASSGSSSNTGSHPASNVPGPTNLPSSGTGAQPSGTAPTDAQPTSGSTEPTVPVRTGAGGKLAAPSSFDGYSALDNAAARSAEQVIASAAAGDSSGSGAIITASTITVYGKTGTQVPSLIVLALPAKSVPDGLTGDSFTGAFLAGVGGTPAPVDAGSHGGSAQCAVNTATTSETLCSWADTSTAGGIVSVNPALPSTALATVQNSFRDAVD